jgi:hypothetical protein
MAPAPDGLRPYGTKCAAPLPPVHTDTGKSSNAANAVRSCRGFHIFRHTADSRSAQPLRVRFAIPVPWARPQSDIVLLAIFTQSKRCAKKFLRCHPCYFSPPSLKTQIAVCLPNKIPKTFAVDSRGEERAKRLSNAKYSYRPQRGAKPAQGRNEINGRCPPPAGRMPFMSDSTLSRRSAALYGPNSPNRLPTENSEEPEFLIQLF